MAQDYMNSDKISVFPMAVNRAIRPMDNTLSEKNLASLITSIVDVDSFVVGLEEDILRFVLAGYHFELYDVSEFLSEHSSWSAVWATVNVDVSNKDIPFLKGGDADGDFTAVILTDTEPANANTTTGSIKTVSIQLFSKSTGEWTVPKSSGVKFNQSSIGGLVVDIDGGVID